MASIVVNGDTSGSVTLSAPATAGTVTVTLPSASGTMAVTGGSPSFASLTVTGDASIDGLTVGQGGGNVATNTALGASALSANTSGSNNVAVGYRALSSMTTGNTCVAVGQDALKVSVAGTQNTAVGFQSMAATLTADANSALGLNSLSSNTTGNNNTAVGYAALTSNTTASNNTAVGYQAGYSTTTGTGNNQFFGYQAGYAVTTGDSNTFIGTGAGYSTTATTTGTANTYIGNASRGANAGSTREIVIGFNLSGNGSNTCAIGSDNGKVYSNFTINATWTQTSDGRMKTNIQDDSLGLSFINRLRPVKFTWKPSNELEQDNPYYKEENTRDTTTVIHGLIAQEVKTALDAEGVDTFAGWDMGADGIQAISREMFVTPLIKAIQELKAELDTVKAELAALKG